MGAATLDRTDVQQVRDEWVGAYSNLVEQIKGWIASQKGWRLEESEPRLIQEESTGSYSAPDIAIITDDGSLSLGIMRRGSVESPGWVELAGWPTQYRVVLLHNTSASEWKVLTDSGITLRQEWNGDNFILLAKDLLSVS